MGLGVPDAEKELIRKMMEQEQSEGAIRDCILEYQQGFMKSAMMLRGAYLAYYACGFTASESLMMVLKSIETLRIK